jgi:DNA replication protein DnaC
LEKAMLSERDRKQLLKLKKQIIEECPQCRGMDYRCSCVDAFRFEFKKVKANVAAKYRDLTFAQITHPQTTEVRAKIGKYITDIEKNLDEGKGLFLYGSTGLAKTGLASIVLMEAIRRGRSGYFITLNALVDLYADGWKDEDKKQQYEDLVLGVDILVIDEVGNESKTNTTLVGGCLNDVLRRRFNNLQTTIITSNLYFKKVKDVYGEEVYSILNESTTQHEFKGVDYRQGMAS